MGQATADLPDPLAASSDSTTSTDDLLAKLAGEEIERLLAETDSGTDLIAESRTPSPIIASPVPAAKPSTPVPPAPAPAPGKPAAHAHDDLDVLLTQLDEQPVTPPARVEKKVAPKVVKNEEPSVADALAEEMAEDAAQHARPMSAAHDAPSKKGALEVSKGVSTDAEAQPSIFVRTLAALSSPLDSFPDHVRDLIGKIAIITTVNALCVLAYVLFLRH